MLKMPMKLPRPVLVFIAITGLLAAFGAASPVSAQTVAEPIISIEELEEFFDFNDFSYELTYGISATDLENDVKYDYMYEILHLRDFCEYGEKCRELVYEYNPCESCGQHVTHIGRRNGGYYEYETDGYVFEKPILVFSNLAHTENVYTSGRDLDKLYPSKTGLLESMTIMVDARRLPSFTYKGKTEEAFEEQSVTTLEYKNGDHEEMSCTYIYQKELYIVEKTCKTIKNGVAIEEIKKVLTVVELSPEPRRKKYKEYEERRGKACKNQKSDNCFWAKVGLAFAAETFGIRNDPYKFKAADKKKLPVKLEAVAKRWRKTCSRKPKKEGEAPTAACEKLGKSIQQGVHFAAAAPNAYLLPIPSTSTPRM